MHIRSVNMPGSKQLWYSHPRKFGAGSRQCRTCGNNNGIIRKYGLNMCRQCFRQYAGDIGFVKVGSFSSSTHTSFSVLFYCPGARPSLSSFHLLTFSLCVSLVFLPSTVQINCTASNISTESHRNDLCPFSSKLDIEHSSCTKKKNQKNHSNTAIF